jgi:hypothetical protein
MGLLCIIIDFTWIINALQLLSVQVHAAVSISVASDMSEQISAISVLNAQKAVFQLYLCLTSSEQYFSHTCT